MVVEVVQDPGRLEDRPGSHALGEDLRRVCLLPADRQAPSRVPSPRDGGPLGFLVADTRLEAQRDIGPLPGLDEVRSSNGEWGSGLLLVTREDHLDLGALQEACFPERLERVERDDVTALHVLDARPRGPSVVQPLEVLEGVVGLEDRVQVPDEQDLSTPVAVVTSDQVPAAAHRALIRPLGLHADRIELGAEDATDLLDALDVERAAVDADEALDEGGRFVGVRLHPLDDAALVVAQRLGRDRRREGEEDREREEQWDETSCHGSRVRCVCAEARYHAGGRRKTGRGCHPAGRIDGDVPYCHTYGMIKRTFVLDDESAAYLDRAAARLGISKSQVVREALRVYGEQMGRLTDEERNRVLASFDRGVASLPDRPREEVEAELTEVARSRQGSGRRTP